jgi:hypothetical protein
MNAREQAEKLQKELDSVCWGPEQEAFVIAELQKVADAGEARGMRMAAEIAKAVEDRIRDAAANAYPAHLGYMDEGDREAIATAEEISEAIRAKADELEKGEEKR